MYSPALRGALAPSACGVGLAAPSGSNVRRTAASAQAPDTVIHRASGRWRGCDRGRLPRRDPVCTENSIRVDHVSKSLNVSDDDRAILLWVALFVSPFKSKSRLETENASLRHQLVILRRKVRGRVRLTDADEGCDRLPPHQQSHPGSVGASPPGTGNRPKAVSPSGGPS